MIAELDPGATALLDTLDDAQTHASTRYLEHYVRKYPDDPRQQLDSVHALDLDDGQHVLVRIQTLWGLCAAFSILEAMADTVKARIAALGKETGRQWYGRGER